MWLLFSVEAACMFFTLFFYPGRTSANCTHSPRPPDLFGTEKVQRIHNKRTDGGGCLYTGLRLGSITLHYFGCDCGNADPQEVRVSYSRIVLHPPLSGRRCVRKRDITAGSQ